MTIMKKLAFIGHSHHSITKSSNFFKRELEREFLVKAFAIDPSGSWEQNIKDLLGLSPDEFDGIVLWQIDYLASYFLRRGLPVIVCPMYDSSSVLEPVHWTSIRQAHIICFSLELHWLIAKAGVDSIYVKYSPPLRSAPLSSEHQAKNSFLQRARKGSGSKKSLRAFFWERLPDTQLSSQQVIRLLSQLEIERLHIHQAPDPGRSISKIAIHSPDFEITTSTWFDSVDDYHTLLQESDVFIAPRFSEGIGMSFLEAMGHGCCVIAHDMATHNEYIRNWDNGILVNFESEIMPLAAGASQICDMAQKAQEDVRRIRENWEEFYLPLMLNSVNEYLSGFKKETTILSRQGTGVSDSFSELKSLFAAHNNWSIYYSWLKSLDSQQFSKKRESSRGTIETINELERKGEYKQALDILDKIIESQSTPGIYELIKRQLIERISLRGEKIDC